MSASSRGEAESTGRVIPFRSQVAPSTTAGPLDWSELLGVPEAAGLKALIESAILNAYVRAQLSTPAAALDNPFDPIYFSELKPDPIALKDRRMIVDHREIVDLSASVSFADGWDE